MKKIFLMIAIASVIALSYAFATDAQIDKAAPDFTLKDSQGNVHTLEQYRGKYVILEWINFGCPFVKKHYDTENMQKLQKKYTDKDVVWLSICSSAEGKQGYMANDDINEALEDKEAAMTAYLIDEDGKVGKQYGAKTTPDIRIINPDGILIYAGAIDDKPSTTTGDVKGALNYIDAVFAAIDAGEKVSPKVTKPYGCSVKYK